MTLRYFAGWDIGRGMEMPHTLNAGASAGDIGYQLRVRLRGDENGRVHVADLGDAIASGVAETLIPPAHIYREYVVELDGRTPLFLYRFAGEEFAYGEDVRKAEMLTRAEAEYRVAKLGEGWRVRRIP